MELVRKFVSIFRPFEREDPFFGKLVYMDMGSKKLSYWEARKLFHPTGESIELFIDAPAPKALPSELQRAFYQRVESKYTDLVESALPHIRSSYREYNESPMTVALEQEFFLSSITIPLNPIERAEWELSFESRSEAGHL